MQTPTYDRQSNPLCDQKGLATVDLNLLVLGEHRKKTLWGDAWRKPIAHSGLLQTEPAPKSKWQDDFVNEARRRN